MFELTRRVKNGVWCCREIKWHEGNPSYYTYDNKAREVEFNAGEYKCTTEYKDLPDGGYLQIEHHNKFGDIISTYDKCGRIIKIESNQDTTEYKYDGTDNIRIGVFTKNKDEEASSFRYEYTHDKNGNMTSIKHCKGFPSLEEYKYDEKGNVVEYTITNYKTGECLYSIKTVIEPEFNRKVQTINNNDSYKVIIELNDRGEELHIINEVPDDVVVVDAYGNEDVFVYDQVKEIFIDYDENENPIAEKIIYRDGDETINKYYYLFIPMPEAEVEE